APEVDVNPITEGSPTVGGTSEPGSTVTVTFPDGSTEETTVNPDGTWTVDVPTDVTLQPGDTVTAVSTDEAGNTSEPSTETVTAKPDVDTTAPEISINPVQPGDTTVGGESEPGSTVVVTLPDGSTTETTVKPDGTWEVTVPALEEGDKVIAIAIDEAGNKSDAVAVVVPTKGQPSTTAPVSKPTSKPASVVQEG
ncbi:Ig-like domain-containing protein, partial [Staphylococcus capitis]|uniref:Ig-like domain-containing protein n=1 Tax=Staphylococcus capitis TaxID=29388 RepID=UPI00066A7E3B